MLPVILLLALVVRAGLLAMVWGDGQERIYTPDSQAYIQLSHSLVEQGTFQREGRRRSSARRVSAAADLPCRGDAWWRAVLVGQVVLDVVLVYLTFLLGWMLLGGRAVIAAALLAFEPLAAGVCLRILSDSVYAFLFTLAVLLLAHDLRSARWALAAGRWCWRRRVTCAGGAGDGGGGGGVMLLAGGVRRWVRAGRWWASWPWRAHRGWCATPSRPITWASPASRRTRCTTSPRRR